MYVVYIVLGLYIFHVIFSRGKSEESSRFVLLFFVYDCLLSLKMNTFEAFYFLLFVDKLIYAP
jgi:hypothetical protein